MPHPLAESGDKVKRASRHLEVLHSEIRTFAASDPKPYRFVPEIDKAASRYLLRVKIERTPPSDWSLIAGDFVQNLRAALDYLVWQLVIANKGEPVKANAFPLFDHPPPSNPKNRSRKSWDAKLAGVHPDGICFIESCQPYGGSDGPDRHLFAALRELSNQDKHRSLMPAFSAIQRQPDLADIEVVGVSDVEAPIERGQLHTGHALADGDLVLEAPVQLIGPNPEIEMKGHLPLDVAFGEILIPLEGLRQMCHAVAETVVMARHLFDA